MPNATIGVLYQNDAYGKNYYAGLRVGLGEAKAKIVDAESYDATNPNVQQQIIAKALRVFVVDASKVAFDLGLGARSNTILQTCFFALSAVSCT